MLRRILLALALLATGEAAKAKADPKECEVCIANLEAIDKLIDKDEKTSKQSIMEAITKHEAVWKSPHFSAMTRPSWIGRVVRNRHRHAVEQASRRWRGDDAMIQHKCAVKS